MTDADRTDSATDDYAAVVAEADRDLPPETVAAMVSEMRPSWSVRDAAPAEEGNDVVYVVTVETPGGPRECVLKACEFLDPRAFRPEPHLMKAVGRRTEIPVPGVVGAVDDHPDLPAPFYLMERRGGEVREGEARDLPAAAIERLARDAGRYLAQLHALGEFEEFGTVLLGCDARRESHTSGLTVADRDSPAGGRVLTTDESATDSWRERVEEVVASTRGEFHDRFADLESDLRAAVDSGLDALDGEFDAVLGDDDYRLGNLLVDPETGETRAVLDWGNSSTLERQYNLVLAEQYLSGWARHDDPRRERVRAALHEGYVAESDRRKIDFGPDTERRRELYLAVTRMFPLVWFSLWYNGADEDEREEAAEMHRLAVRKLVE